MNSATESRPVTTALEPLQGRSGPIAPEGWPIVLVFALVSGVLAAASWAFLPIWVAPIVLGVGVVLTGWCLWFFRDPMRQVPAGADVVVSPADGRVVAVDGMAPPKEAMRAAENAGLCRGDAAWVRISVFMNVFDVHVNRAPVKGVVVAAIHKDGLFVNAALPKASEENERLSLVQRMENGAPAISVQIAGLVARRIICRVAPGVMLEKAQRFGLIRFGSRVDVFLPAGAVPAVKPGDRCVAGATVLATLSGLAKADSGRG